MLDIKFIRENIDLVKYATKNKRIDVDVAKFLKLDEKRRGHLVKLEQLRAEQNRGSRGRTSKPSKEEIVKLKELAEKIKLTNEAQHAYDEEYEKLLWLIPNVVHSSVPKGKNETENKVIRKWGNPRSSLRDGAPSLSDNKPKEHWELGADLDIIDIPRAARVSGARFAYFKGKLALLQFALMRFAFDVATNEKTLAKIAKAAKLKVSTKPFIPVIPPVMMNPEVMNKMARLEPRAERYHIPSDDLYLVGSAEHTLGPLHMDEILDEADLPIRYIGYSTAFRREAGSYGKDTKGIIRVHQFDKVEFESFSTPEQGIVEQDFLIAIQEYFMQELGIPYQVVFKCIGDMGAPDFREYDIECWMPGQGKYRETHTADYVTDYQARRLNIKYKSTVNCELKTANFVHMNDATALAMSRTPVAILENYQQKDGSIKMPKVLIPYCGFDTIT